MGGAEGIPLRARERAGIVQGAEDVLLEMRTRYGELLPLSRDEWSVLVPISPEWTFSLRIGPPGIVVAATVATAMPVISSRLEVLRAAIPPTHP